MDAVLDEDAARAAGIPEPVVGGEVFVGGVVLEREAPDRAEHALAGDLDREQLGQRRDEWREAQQVIDGDDAPGLSGGLGDAAAAVDVDGERLLDEHVPPGSEGLDGEGGVRPRGCGDDDDVDVAIGEEPVEVGLRSRPTGGRRRGERRGPAACRRRRPARRWGARRWRRRGTCRTPRTRGVRAGGGHRHECSRPRSARGAPPRCCCRPCRRTRSRGRRSSRWRSGTRRWAPCRLVRRRSRARGAARAVRAMTRDGSSGSSSIAPARYTSEPCWDGSKPGATSPWTPWWMRSQPSGTRIGGGPAPILALS